MNHFTICEHHIKIYRYRCSRWVLFSYDLPTFWSVRVFFEFCHIISDVLQCSGINHFNHMKVVVSLFPCMCLHFNEPFYLYRTKRINGPNIIRGWGRQREKQVANYILNLLGACKCRYYIIDVAFANAINIGAWFLGWRADAVEAVIESTGCSFELICGCIDEHIISTPKLISNGLWFLVLFWFDFIVMVNQTHWTHEWDVVSSNIQTQPTEMNFQQNNRNGN